MLEYSIIVKLLTEHNLEFLSLKGGCRGSSESTLVKMPHCWKSHAGAHFLLLPNVLYKESFSIFDCLATFLSLPVRSGFEELFPGKTFLTVSQSRDRLISCTLMTSNVKLSSVTL